MNPNKILYIPFDKFTVRIPFLPIESLKDNFKSVETLFDLLSNTKVAEAIYIASPVLYDEINKSIASPQKFSAKDMNRIIYSFARYINRMATRCTPFGMFAGCAVGNIGEHTSVEIGPSIQRHARLDMDFLYAKYIFSSEYTKYFTLFQTNIIIKCTLFQTRCITLCTSCEK
ncbi:MAG: lantibiotic dehydratase [Candidatus Aphodosoma sp.]